MSEEKGTDAITGITNFLFLAFILPGVIYVCFVVLLFGVSELQKLLPGISMDWDVGIAAVIFLGLTITSVAFVIEIVFLKIISYKKKKARAVHFKDYSINIFRADRNKELGWYFWQLWGQSIMHFGIATGVLIIYVVYRYLHWNDARSWKDWTILVIAANYICHWRFRAWHESIMNHLSDQDKTTGGNLSVSEQPAKLPTGKK